MSGPWSTLEPYRALMRQLHGAKALRLLEDLDRDDPAAGFAVDFQLVDFSPFAMDVPETDHPDSEPETRQKDPRRRSLHGRQPKKTNPATTVEPQLKEALRQAFPRQSRQGSAPTQNPSGTLAKLAESELPDSDTKSHGKGPLQNKTEVLDTPEAGLNSQAEPVTTPYPQDGSQNPLGPMQGSEDTLAQLTDRLMSPNGRSGNHPKGASHHRKETGSVRPMAAESRSRNKPYVASAGEQSKRTTSVSDTRSSNRSASAAVYPSRNQTKPSTGFAMLESKSPTSHGNTRTATGSTPGVQRIREAEATPNLRQESGWNSPQSEHQKPAPQTLIQSDAMGPTSPGPNAPAPFGSNLGSGNLRRQPNQDMAPSELAKMDSVLRDPVSRDPVSRDPVSRDPGDQDLVDMVNDALVEQARIHGVDLW